MKTFAPAMVLAMALSSPVIAADKFRVVPVADGETNIRFLRGTPSIEVARNGGTVQITPRPMYRDRLVFTVAVFNKGMAPANFGVETLSLTRADGQAARVLSMDDLVRQAENRALWAQIGTALLGAGAAAGASDFGKSTYKSTMITPSGGVYRYRSTYENHATSALATGAAIGGTAYAMNQISAVLDATVARLGNEVVQTTTIDPGHSYGGHIVVDKLKNVKAWPLTVRLAVNWNGEQYPFTFKVGRRGDAMPMPTATPARSLMVMAPVGADPMAAGPNQASMDALQALPIKSPSQSRAAFTAVRSQSAAPRGDAAGAIFTGVVTLVPAQTASGYCIEAPPGYVGAGSVRMPAVTTGQPLCESLLSR